MIIATYIKRKIGLLALSRANVTASQLLPSYPVSSWLPEPTVSHCSLHADSQTQPTTTACPPASDSPSITTVPIGVCNDHLPHYSYRHPFSLQTLHVPPLLRTEPPSLFHLVPSKYIPSTSICVQKEKKNHLHFKEKGHMNGCPV